MTKKQKKYYAIKKGRNCKNTITISWEKCKSLTHKYPSVFKSFETLEEAEKYLGYKYKFLEGNGLNKRPTKICIICEKPYKSKNKCCPSCTKELKLTKDAVNPFLKYKIRGNKIPIDKVIAVKNKYNSVNVFELIKHNPRVLFGLEDINKRKQDVKDLKKTYMSKDYREKSYKKWTSEIPMYIYDLMKLHPSKKLITLSGDKLNPNIHYICLKCNSEFMQTYKDLKSNKGHNCTGSKSSGEVVVEEYLNQFVEIKTQRDTLKCINPITGRQMPYDIEVIGKNILIEIQGEQHLKYVEYFHGTIDNFHYQQRKDSYKKRFAEKKGYKLIYIYYDDIKNGIYKEKLKQCI